MTDLEEHPEFWELGNVAVALGGTVACLIAVAVGMYFARSLWA